VRKREDLGNRGENWGEGAKKRDCRNNGEGMKPYLAHCPSASPGPGGKERGRKKKLVKGKRWDTVGGNLAGGRQSEKQVEGSAWLEGRKKRIISFAKKNKGQLLKARPGGGGGGLGKSNKHANKRSRFKRGICP